jgi:hypothetical protein
LPSAISAGKLFATRDRELDRATSGPMWLKDARVAQVVVEALHYGEFNGESILAGRVLRPLDSVEEWPWSSATPRADDKIVRATMQGNL